MKRRKWILVDLATTLVLGVLEDVLIPGHDSLDVLDDLDFREWLDRKGAEPASINSAPVRNAYEIVFGYRGGDDSQPSFAAGTAARFLLRWVVTYRGGFIYEMQAGMGDVVFAPLYLTLQDRGVGFRFFHSALSLHLDASGRNVAGIHLAEQVKLTKPEYAPLIDVKGLPCWPAQPLYDLIDPGQAAELRALKAKYPGVEPLESSYSPWVNYREFDLKLGVDFDKVVLGISLAALPALFAELMAADSRFKDMVDQVGTVATQSFQLWLDNDAQQLGFQGSESAILDSYRDSFADFSHLIAQRASRRGPSARSATSARRWKTWDRSPRPDLTPIMSKQWPTASKPGVATTSSVARTECARSGPTLMTQVPANSAGTSSLTRGLRRGRPGPVRLPVPGANVDLSSRYVQALTGTTKYRLKACESGFDNLALAGDWIRTGINAGCIEGATVGGMQAARAICGSPEQISGENDFCRLGHFGAGVRERASLRAQDDRRHLSPDR